jgi:hypothetical protein
MLSQAVFSSPYKDQAGLYALRNRQEFPNLRQATNFSTQYREGFLEESQFLTYSQEIEDQHHAQELASRNRAGYNRPSITPGEYEELEGDYGYGGTYTQPQSPSAGGLVTVLTCVSIYPCLTTDTIANDSSLSVFKCIRITPMAVLDAQAHRLTKMLLERNLRVHQEQANAAA